MNLAHVGRSQAEKESFACLARALQTRGGGWGLPDRWVSPQEPRSGANLRSFKCFLRLLPSHPPPTPGGAHNWRYVNGNGEFSPQAESYGYLRGDLVTGFELGTPFPGGFYPDISVGPFIPQFAAYSQLPAIRDLPTLPPAGQSDPEAAGNGAVQAVEVVDPSTGQTTTVFEDAPGGIYETNRAPTDWDAVYREYVILNAPRAPEVEAVIDWGKVAGGIVGGYLDPFGAGTATRDFFGMAQPMGAIPGPVSRAGPAGQVKIDPQTGKLVKCRRRRRRRLLTDGDFNDLMRISTLPNKDIVKIALAKAVGR